MARIIILNGVAKKNGNTAKLVNAFKESVSEEHEITDFYLQNRNIKGCLDCGKCIETKKCVQNDDMSEILDKFSEADIVVFASPMYWGTVSGTLKTAVDRLYPYCNPYKKPPMKETVLLMTANSTMYQMVLNWYGIFQLMGWKNRGMALGSDSIGEAERLGREI